MLEWTGNVHFCTICEIKSVVGGPWKKPLKVVSIFYINPGTLYPSFQRRLLYHNSNISFNYNLGFLELQLHVLHGLNNIISLCLFSLSFSWSLLQFLAVDWNYHFVKTWFDDSSTLGSFHQWTEIMLFLIIKSSEHSEPNKYVRILKLQSA